VFGASFAGYLNKEHKLVEFTLEKYQEIGETLCKGFFVLSKSLIQNEVIQHHFIKKLSSKWFVINYT
jgi:hypothetical protein